MKGNIRDDAPAERVGENCKTAPATIRYVYWFAYYNLDAPSVRYRAAYPLEYGKKHLGIGYSLVVPGYSPMRVLRFLGAYLPALFFPKKNAVIVVQRVQSKFIYARLLLLLARVRRKSVIYDLDDADYLVYPPQPIHHFARTCGHVAAGSREIAEYLRKYNPGTAHITSPAVDLGILKVARSETFTIGWVGGFAWGHRESLFELVFPAVKALDFQCELVLVGVSESEDRKEINDYFAGCAHLRIRMPTDTDWRDERALQQTIATFDVGVATLSDTPVQRAKSGIKAKQYLCCGVPVMCNDLPENNAVVVHDFNGLVCGGTDEFQAGFRRFHDMAPETYRQFGENARASLVHFDADKYFGDLNALVYGPTGPTA